MTYAVKECFLTLQGEGMQAGARAVFLRFAGCNLWSGLERDRATAQCQFCDTDFVGTDGEGGGKFADARTLAAAIAACWGNGAENRYVVFTGGEPLLQLDDALVAAVHAQGFTIAIETNGTIAPPAGIDWICVSPKGTSQVVVTRGNELKLVYPQLQALPERYAHLDFEHFFLQPMDGPARVANTERIVRYCLQHPQWRLSLQTHKYIGIP
ncbi:MAG TPA: 7-carboxy-7-deazaguanine synthase [Bordetella sp.]|uniref:7-carboxy-7-deazaguanine synthase n=1 Tax=Bordetella sp. TaxID=28081 RepID=UPI002ED1F1D7